jgi:hypothetical protein
MNPYRPNFIKIFLSCLCFGFFALNALAQDNVLVSESRIEDAAERRLDEATQDFEEEEIILLELYGEVTEVSLEQSEIVVKALMDEDTQSYEEITLHVNEDTEILKEDRDATLAEVVVGDDVALLYLEVDNKKIINTLWVENE